MMDRQVITHKEKPLFEWAKMPTPFRIQAVQEDFACFFYLVNGNYQVIESNGGYKIGAREALVKKCGRYVANFIESDTSEVCEAIAVYLYPDMLQNIYKYLDASIIQKPRPKSAPYKVSANELIEKYINNLKIYFEDPDLIDEELATLKLKELILILLKTDQFENVQSFLTSLFNSRELEFTNIIENNIFSNISIEELAHICNKSLSSFKREFKRLYNESPARYIKHKRLEQAAKLLLTTDDSVSGVAYDSGFQDVSTFSAAFVQKYNISPSKYRMSQIGK